MLFGRKNKKPKAGWDVPVQAEALTPLEEYQKRPGFNDVLQLAIDLCRALEAREKEGIPHGDVRPENIYITKDGVFQLGGAGTAVESVESAETAAGKAADAAYMAPEVWKGGPDSTTAVSAAKRRPPALLARGAGACHRPGSGKCLCPPHERRVFSGAHPRRGPPGADHPAGL